MKDQSSMDEQQGDIIAAREFLGWAECIAWAALVVAPIIYWLQGPSVSIDQFVVRTAVVVVAALGGLGLRIHALFRKLGRRRGPAEVTKP